MGFFAVQKIAELVWNKQAVEISVSGDKDCLKLQENEISKTLWKLFFCSGKLFSEQQKTLSFFMQTQNAKLLSSTL